jgi:hypothetical protein
MSTKPSINEEIRVDFIRGLVQSNASGYHISLETIYGWFGESDRYAKYINNLEYRKDFKNRILRNPAYILNENKTEITESQDFIMRKGTNKVEIPWFSTDGFKHFCMLKNTKKSRYIYDYYRWIEKEYYRKATEYYEENNSDNVIIELVEKVNRFTLKLLETKRELKKCREERDEYKKELEKYMKN